MASAAEQIAYEGYLRLLPRRTELYQVIIIGLKYTKIAWDGIRNNVSINRVPMVAREEEFKLETKSDQRAKNNTSPASKALLEAERSSYTAEKMLEHKTYLHRRAIPFYGTATGLMKTQSNQPLTSPTIYMTHTADGYREVTEVICLQEEKEG